MEYVAVHYNQSLKLSDAARIVDLSPVYFGNLFKQQTGMSFRQYITTIRLNQAENMLLNGENTVGEVAELCGFSDAFYFSKVYREQREYHHLRFHGFMITDDRLFLLGFR